MSKLAVAGVALVWALTAGCGSRTSQTDPKMYKMGERVQVKPLIYTVLDTEWLDSLGEPPEARMPQHHFMAVRVSVTNSGAATSGIPAITMVDAGGNSFTELTDGRGLTDWLGYLRTIKPAETIHGRALFDLPAASYKLNLMNDADPEDARTATVDIPLDLRQTSETTK